MEIRSFEAIKHKASPDGSNPNNKTKRVAKIILSSLNDKLTSTTSITPLASKPQMKIFQKYWKAMLVALVYTLLKVFNFCSSFSLFGCYCCQIMATVKNTVLAEKNITAATSIVSNLVLFDHNRQFNLV